MRFMKAIVIGVLVYVACFMLVLVLAQIFTGHDFSAAYAAVGSVGAVELALTSIIKRQEKLFDKKTREDDEK